MTTKPFKGVSTIHKGADELIEYVTIDQFDKQPEILPVDDDARGEETLEVQR